MQHRPREKKAKLTGTGHYDRQAARQEAGDFTETSGDDLDFEDDGEDEAEGEADEEDPLSSPARSPEFHSRRDSRSHSRWLEDHLAKDGTWG